ncbi:MAG TPA: 4-vinyl reductase [Candidatus Bathyarchaeia archaeon]|nr:4-vinyl reductase [Candidatus Bathyarchaeia archaeon]
MPMKGERYNLIKEKWDIENGQFFTQELPTIIMGSAIFVGIQKLAESIVGADGAAVIFYEAGKKVGVLRTKSWKDEWELEGQEFIEKLEEYLAELGWGKFCVDLESLVVTMENSFAAKNYGDSDVPVCHFLRGYYAGMGEVLTNRALDAEETKCAACGADLCEFVLKPIE